jgi:hypothetical protein
VGNCSGVEVPFYRGRGKAGAAGNRGGGGKWAPSWLPLPGVMGGGVIAAD